MWKYPTLHQGYPRDVYAFTPQIEEFTPNIDGDDPIDNREGQSGGLGLIGGREEWSRDRRK